MIFVSTRGRSDPVGLRQALLCGLAPDGGLYLPQTLSPLPPDRLQSFPTRDWREIAATVAVHLLGDEIPATTVARLIEDSLDFDVPLREIEPDVSALELFHGPTLAFKDVGARFMAQLMSCCLDGETERRIVLVATSGDTGSAIAHAFHHLDPFEVVILFPDGKVSPRQRKQFSTLSGNVRTVAIDGTFDDCQSLVKTAFGDAALRPCRLVSANSINVGRLLPQIFYYFQGVARLGDSNRTTLIAVPCGNFGNLTAGLIALRLGLRVDRFVAATNANDVIPEYLETGTYRPRPSLPTLSNAMDVGDPSNFERISHLYGGDPDALRHDLLGFSFADTQTRAAIRSVYGSTGTVLDPHAAVGYLGLRKGLERHPGGRGFFLATAHPAKFPEVVETETGVAPPVPDRLHRLLDRDENLIPMPADSSQLRELLLSI